MKTVVLGNHLLATGGQQLRRPWLEPGVYVYVYIPIQIFLRVASSSSSFARPSTVGEYSSFRWKTSRNIVLTDLLGEKNTVPTGKKNKLKKITLFIYFDGTMAQDTLRTIS